MYQKRCFLCRKLVVKFFFFFLIFVYFVCMLPLLVKYNLRFRCENKETTVPRQDVGVSKTVSVVNALNPDVDFSF